MIRICKTSWVHWENIRYTLKPTSQFNAQNPSARFCSDRTIQKANLCTWFFNSGYIQNIQQSYSRHIYVHVCVCVCVCTSARYNFFENQFMYKNWAGLQGKGFISVLYAYLNLRRSSVSSSFWIISELLENSPVLVCWKNNQSQLFWKPWRKSGGFYEITCTELAVFMASHLI
jgi:hypothetical protein